MIDGSHIPNFEETLLNRVDISGIKNSFDCIDNDSTLQLSDLSEYILIF